MDGKLGRGDIPVHDTGVHLVDAVPVHTGSVKRSQHRWRNQYQEELTHCGPDC
jgi:hypothetical protein